eukprot:1776267-Prymnesium_polylepis.1
MRYARPQARNIMSRKGWQPLPNNRSHAREVVAGSGFGSAPTLGLLRDEETKRALWEYVMSDPALQVASRVLASHNAAPQQLHSTANAQLHVVSCRGSAEPLASS